MNITPTITVEISIALTEPEAREILINPARFQKQLRDALGAHHAARGNGKQNLALGARANKNGHKPAPKESVRPAGGGECPQCGRAYKSTKRLETHLKSCRGTASVAG